jgi:hypothetical protein
VSAEDPTQPLDDGEGPTEPIPSGGEDPTEALAGEMETGHLADGNDAPTEQQPQESWAPHQPEVKAGTGILVASILASIALIVTYIFAGGLDYKPTPVADPCDSRAWSDPTGFEDVAQQIAFSALDGAACDLGVSREELTRAIATTESQREFLDRNGISDGEFADALRSGITRAADDAENAGAIDPLVASGIRTAVRILPVEQLIPLIQNASSLLEGGSGLGDLLGGGSGTDSGLGGILNGLGDLLGGGGSGDGNPGGSGIEDLIPRDLPQDLQDLQDQIPPELQDQLNQQLQQGLDNLLNP